MADPLTALSALTLPTGETWGAAMERDPWIERDVLGPVLERNPDGTPRYRICWIELARGHGKTSLVAGVGLVAALGKPGVNVFCIATDAEQASLVLESLDGQQRRNPKLAQHLKQAAARLTVKRTGSYIRVMASDAPSGFGLAPDARRVLFIADEVTHWRDRSMYDLVTTTLPKAHDAQLVVITNAGILGSWQETARRQVEALAAEGKAYIFAPEGVIASWIRPADLEIAAQTVEHPLIFERLYGNRWTERAAAFTTMTAWDACAGNVPPLGAMTPGIVGVDAAVSGDCFAIVAVSLDGEDVLVRELALWAPEAGRPLDFDEPRSYLAAFCAAHNVQTIAYDPYQLHDFMQRFQQAHTISVEPFQQGPPRVRADSHLLQLIRNGRLRHDGDARLREHVQNAGFKVSPIEDSQGRLVKRGQGKIDAVVALSMASWTALAGERELGGQVFRMTDFRRAFTRA